MITLAQPRVNVQGDHGGVFSWFCTILGTYALVGGAVSFGGWLLDAYRPTDWLNTGVSIQPNTSVLMMLAGAGVVLLQIGRERLVAGIGAFVALAGVLTLAQYIVGADFGFNHQLLFGREWGQSTTLTRGRMGPPASTSFALIGICLLILALSQRGHRAAVAARRFVPACGLVVCAFMLFSLIGYLFGAEQFYAVPWLTAIALQTSSMLMCLGLAVIAAVPERNPRRLLFEETGAAMLGRLVLPLLIVLPPAVIWLRSKGQDSALYDLGTGRALGAILLIVAGVTVMWWALELLRRRELALRDSEARHRALFEAAVYGAIAIDEQGIIQSVNPAAQRIFGYSSGELVGWNISMLMPDPYKAEHDSYLSNYLRTGVARIIGIGREVVGLRKDGSTFPMDLAVAEFRLRGKRYFKGTISDISQRKQAEQALRHHGELLEMLIDRAPLGVYLVDADFRIAKVNPVALPVFGEIPGGVVGRDFEQVMHILWDQTYADEIVRIFRHTLETGESYFTPEQAEYRIDRQKTEYYEWRLDRITLPDGRWGLVCYFRDVSQQVETREALRRAKEEAEAANIAKDNFLATLSHELRTPLTPVLATLSSWEALPSWPAELSDDLGVVHRNIELEARLIDDLLDLTRIARGKIALNMEVLDVQKLLDAVIGMYAGEIQAKGIDLLLRPQAPNCCVRADPGRLQQALWNVLKNAVKFTPAGGRIEVQTRNHADGRIQIIISDSGIGMRPQTLGRLFQPFEQETAGRYGGLGLGLAITRALLEAQGATIEAYSAGPGEGATFTITLRCVPKPALPPPARPPSAPAEAPASADETNGRYRVLLVEDHADTARVIARLLSLNGHDVATAHSVKEAIDAIRSREFDVLVSDIGLPDGTGIDLLRQLREQYGLTMPAVALTGFGMEEDVGRTRRAGFNHHLTKPVNLARLEETIQQACRREPEIHSPSDPAAPAAQ